MYRGIKNGLYKNTFVHKSCSKDENTDKMERHTKNNIPLKFFNFFLQFLYVHLKFSIMFYLSTYV
jgi:hypothetical protein